LPIFDPSMFGTVCFYPWCLIRVKSSKTMEA
jgi:hypothetical protein